MQQNNKKETKQEEQSYICQKCNLAMVKQDTGFSYLGKTFRTDILRCPGCGMVYVSEELARGRMKEVEMMMEDK